MVDQSNLTVESYTKCVAFGRINLKVCQVKGKLYSTYVQCVMMYGSETWAMKVEDMQRLERAEKMIFRWMDVWSNTERQEGE